VGAVISRSVSNKCSNESRPFARPSGSARGPVLDSATRVGM
jgi:hypothetical protein